MQIKKEKKLFASKGSLRVTIPHEFHKILGMKENEMVEFELRKDFITIRKKKSA
jgi:bifunctional DNA-binding transcriptional regulator/antitoxin component of YhaV-PrlF toxin-antitoxin module